jgi:hypothetical protein
MLANIFNSIASIFKPQPTAIQGRRVTHAVMNYEGPGLIDIPNGARAFGAGGDAPGSMMERPVSVRLQQVPGVPGGTLYNPVMRSVPAGRMAPLPGGTNTRVSAEYGNAMAANASRGHGHTGQKAAGNLVYAGTRTPGVTTQVPVVRAMAAVDQRNPLIAQHTQPGMVTGATRQYGAPTPAPTTRPFSMTPAYVPTYAMPDISPAYQGKSSPLARSITTSESGGGYLGV